MREKKTLRQSRKIPFLSKNRLEFARFSIDQHICLFDLRMHQVRVSSFDDSLFFCLFHQKIFEYRVQFLKKLWYFVAGKCKTKIWYVKRIDQGQITTIESLLKKADDLTTDNNKEKQNLTQNSQVAKTNGDRLKESSQKEERKRNFMDSKTPRYNLELSITDATTITDHIWY